MSKMRYHNDYNATYRTNLSRTPKKSKTKANLFVDYNNLKENSIELNSNTNNNIKIKVNKKETPPISDQEEQKKKTPKEILASLLKNTLGKSFWKKFIFSKNWSRKKEKRGWKKEKIGWEEKDVFYSKT